MNLMTIIFYVFKISISDIYKSCTRELVALMFTGISSTIVSFGSRE